MSFNCVIKKFECIDSVLVGTEIGYVDSEDRDSFETLHPDLFTTWVDENQDKAFCEYFDTHSPFYLIDSTNSPTDGLTLITDLENPEA